VSAAFTIIYDLRGADAQRKAHSDRNLWGKLYTDIHALDNDHVALVFRSAGCEEWKAFEVTRKRWILEGHASRGEAAA
jgi:hypothetical protein